ncbi:MULTISPECIES: LysR family transcriptional regulator [Enterocloster]|uniref:DNA-binding transcriptional regulator, LysR family n=1 Tax=Enterocloster lavalensis TaxID=460384 RepID=A0A1I0J1H0_9FIRM|nr:MULTISPECIES: LysR family transcriptional regulator [Enterocloster]MDR3758817.1 LysR family transcriptional regulator [Enterocloster sp.]PST33924.1 LysR family transcriptional regulator [Enterocloster lavalensis]SEU03599.1 DNA-binding transcriptional regulator, LysR family [Enterocloster lavalensis]
MEQNLSQYKIFYEVAKAGNISKAAKELYISQPAISKAIGKLEDSLGLSLFTRSSRGVQLTSEGEILFEHAREAFEALERGEQELRRIQEFDIGHLRIGVSNTLCKYILLPYLKTFIDQYPHMKVTIESQSTVQTLNRLEQQKIDLGLVAEPSLRKDLSFIPVMDIQDIFVSTRAYLENLYLREGPDTNIFETGNIMLLDENNMTRHHVDEYMAENAIFPHQILEVTTMDLLIEFAKIGLGVACVIRELVQKELDTGVLVEIPLQNSISRRTIGFAYHPSNQAMALKTFLEFLY